jgi:hypothetical protein
VDDEVVRELTEAMKTTATQLGETRRTIADWERRGGNAGAHLSTVLNITLYHFRTLRCCIYCFCEEEIAESVHLRSLIDWRTYLSACVHAVWGWDIAGS